MLNEVTRPPMRYESNRWTTDDLGLGSFLSKSHLLIYIIPLIVLSFDQSIIHSSFVPFSKFNCPHSTKTILLLTGIM